MDYLVGLDCSFSRTGISIINLNKKEIIFETASCKIGEKIFENVFHSAVSIVNQLKEILSKYNNYKIVMESPLPNSSMSAALYALDILIMNSFEDHIIKTYNPATLRSKIHGHKYEKKESQELALKYIKTLSENKYIIKSEMGTKRKLCHDCAEAFLYCHLYLKDSGHPEFQFDNSEEIARYKQRKLELKKKEKELLKNQKLQEIEL